MSIRLKLEHVPEIPAHGEGFALGATERAVLPQPIAHPQLDRGPLIRRPHGREEVAAKLEKLHHPLRFFRFRTRRGLDPLHLVLGLREFLLGVFAFRIPGAGHARDAGRGTFHPDQFREDDLRFLDLLVALAEFGGRRVDERLGHREVVRAACQFRVVKRVQQGFLLVRIGALVELRLDLRHRALQLIGRGIEQRAGLRGFFLLLLFGFVDRVLIVAVLGERGHVHAAGLGELRPGIERTQAGQREERLRHPRVARVLRVSHEGEEAFLGFADQADARAFVRFVHRGVQLALRAFEWNLRLDRVRDVGLLLEFLEVLEREVGHPLFAKPAHEIERIGGAGFGRRLCDRPREGRNHCQTERDE